MTPEQIERYKRHILVKEIGGPGQNKLLNGRVTIVGAGALGGQTALTLAAAGVGHIQIFDDDIVELSNLQRQTQFSVNDVGDSKIDALTRRINALNPDVQVQGVKMRWAGEGTDKDADILIDGTDNFESRFDMNAWSLREQKPFITGAVAGWQGQVMLVNDPEITHSPCYRCFVPEAPPNAGNCNDLGVVGAVTTMTANQIALLAIKRLLGLSVKAGDLWLFDGLAGRTRNVTVRKDQFCTVCNS
jgi:molybdopterin/thiamine biosynthesis adenylyltransferase